MLRIADNSSKNIPKQEWHYLPDFQRIAAIEISNKDHELSGLLVFSNQKEKLKEQRIFTIHEQKITTQNLMGFVGLNDCQVSIHSRFAQGEEDYFLHYMLQKVFSINIFDLKHRSTEEDIFNFLLYLFPYYLKKALRQGRYKEYQQKNYNNANVKGVVDIARHIRTNIPFAGIIAYRTREQCFDNGITQLIRHTIEHIKKQTLARNVLANDHETQAAVSSIIQATPSYNRHQRMAIIHRNARPLVHPYFNEYQYLQKICLQILRHEGLKYGQEKDKIHGLLFDGAWLWEEYLNTILQHCDFQHPRNDKRTGRLYLFQKQKSPIYPDFWKENIIIDAKYKRLKDNTISIEDKYQVISYMYVQKANLGGLIYPIEQGEKPVKEQKIGVLNGYGGRIQTWGISIPQFCVNFEAFCKKMEEREEELKTYVKNYETQNFSLNS